MNYALSQFQYCIVTENETRDDLAFLRWQVEHLSCFKNTVTTWIVRNMAGQVHLTNEVFMSELTLMFHNSRKDGTVTTTIKRYDGRTRPEPKVRRLKKGKKSQVVKPTVPLPVPDEYNCLIRAKSKAKKISTVVSPEDALKFQLQFCQFLRSNMDGLKKEKKAKKKAKKATQ